MNHRASLIAAWCICGLAGVAIAALAVAAQIAAGAFQPFAPGQHDHGQHGGASDFVGPTFYAEMNAVNARMHAGMAISPGGNIDRDFMRMMMPHHQGAIDMALVLLKYGRDEKLKRLAQSIIVEQGQEIAYMRTLLEAPTAQTSEPDK
jgi:uncharacterized protein (DUF305 family)